MKYFYHYVFFIGIIILFFYDSNKTILIENLENANDSLFRPGTEQEIKDYSHLCDLPKCFDSSGERKLVCCHNKPPCEGPYCDVICCHPPWFDMPL